jgi:hypothetical protein
MNSGVFPAREPYLLFFIVPLVVSIDDHLSVINGFKFIAIDDFALQIGVQGFDISVVLGRCYMRTLEVCFFLSEIA